VRILSHYFVARFLGLFSTVLAAAVILLVTIEMVLNLDDMASFTSAGADASENPSAFRYLWVRLASYYLADLVPIAAFIAVFIAFAWAGRSMELVAIQAGGIRILRVIVPVLGTALILSCATAILHETLILRAQQIWSAEARGDRHEIDFGRRAFWHQRGRAITNIAEADPTTRTLRGVEIFERGLTGTVVRVIRTDYVRIGSDGSWQIEDAAIWSFDPDDPALAPQLEEHVSMTLELDTLRGEELLGADAGLLPLPILARYLGREPVEETSSNLRRLTRRYHERLSGPWLVLCFALLALPFALRVGPEGGIARPAVEGIAAVSIFFLLRSAGETLAQEELFPLGITPWLTMGLFAASSLWLLRRRAV
jgi:lipopolysaccharide export system permease protein